MKIAVLGATGRTGRLVVRELLEREHDVTILVRDPSRLPAFQRPVTVLVGDATDRTALTELVDGTDAVISALGPTTKDGTLHQTTARALVQAMTIAGVQRFVGISGAGIDVPGDQKSRRDTVISAVIQRVGGPVVKDKPKEYQAWAASGLDWTLVRPPRLNDGPPAPGIEHHAHRSTRSTKISRADLAVFVVDVVEQGWYVRCAPFVAGSGR